MRVQAHALPELGMFSVADAAIFRAQANLRFWILVSRSNLLKGSVTGGRRSKREWYDCVDSFRSCVAPSIGRHAGHLRQPTHRVTYSLSVPNRKRLRRPVFAEPFISEARSNTRTQLA